MKPLVLDKYIFWNRHKGYYYYTVQAPCHRVGGGELGGGPVSLGQVISGRRPIDRWVLTDRQLYSATVLIHFILSYLS